MKSCLFLVFGCLLLPAGAVAQQPRASAAVQVTLVEVPVTVVDRAGRPVAGLTAANFELLEDGKKRKIEHFDVLDFSQTAAVADSQGENSVLPRRNFMLLFDLSNSSPADLEKTREAALAFVQTQLLEHDLVSVGTLSVEGGFKLLTPFTTDRNLAARAVETFGHPRFYRPADPLGLSVGPPSESAGETRGATAEALRQHMEDIARGGNRANDEIDRRRVLEQVSTLAELARLLNRVKGQKQILFLSPGFDARLIHGRESVGSAESQADATASLEGEIWKIDNDQRFGNSNATSQLDQMGTIFRRSDVVLHAVDIRGLRSNVDARDGVKANSNEALHLLTGATGGQVFKNSNNIGEHFGKVLKQQEIVYVLGMKSAGTQAGKFHEVKVKLVNVPGGRLSHRPGYYESPNSTSRLEKLLVTSQALMNDAHASDINIDLISVAFPDVNTPQVPVILEIDGPTLLQAASRTTTLEAEVFVYAFDQQSVVRDFIHQSVKFDLAKTSAALATGGVRLYGTLRLPPGRYAVKSVVSTEGGKLGFDRTDVEVHDEGKPAALPPLLFAEGGNWIMVKAPSPAQIPYPFEIAGESFIPAAKPKLKLDVSYKLALFTYHLGEKLQLSASVRTATGAVSPAKISVAGRTAPDEKGAIKYLLNFQPAGLERGEYTLVLSVGSEGTERLLRTMKFVI